MSDFNVRVGAAAVALAFAIPAAVEVARMTGPAEGAAPANPAADPVTFVLPDGYTDPSRAQRRGDVYLVQAQARAGDRRSLAFDADTGRFLGEAPRPPVERGLVADADAHAND